MDINIEKNKFLHILTGKGWYIDDNEFIDVKRLENSTIIRDYNVVDVLNNPCIYVMSACNGKCKYCYQDGHLRNMTPNLAFEDIENFVFNLSKLQNNNAPKTIELFGGEPLLRKDILKIIELLKSFGYKILIATNGTLAILGDSEFHGLIKENVHIRISLDGHTKELHEKYRTPDSFDKIVENIKKLRRAGIDVSVKSIISDDNFHYIEDMLSFLRDELCVRHWNYNVLYKLGAYHDNGIETNIDHFTMVEELCKEKYNEFMPMMRQTPFTQMLTCVNVKHTKKYRRTYIFLNYDKKIYMNDQLIVPEYSIGDMNNLNLPYLDFIKKYETERNTCKNCFNKDYCYLGNYGELYNKDSSLNSEFPTCDVLRKSIVYLMNQQEKGIDMLRRVYGM